MKQINKKTIGNFIFEECKVLKNARNKKYNLFNQPKVGKVLLRRCFCSASELFCWCPSAKNPESCVGLLGKVCSCWNAFLYSMWCKELEIPVV